VGFVHGRGVLHHDLKPHNLLMDRKTMALKIADLGLSRAITVPVKYTHEVCFPLPLVFIISRAFSLKFSSV
jgi:cyclin-dependent kinase